MISKAFALSVLLVSSVATAHIPPSDFLVKETVKKRQGFKAFKVRSEVVGLKDGKPTGISFREVLILDYSSRVVRSRAQTMDGKDLYLVERKLDGSISPLAGASKVLLENSAPSFVRFLKGVGIPIRTESDLGQFETQAQKREQESLSLQRNGNTDTYAWTIGRAKANESQLWIEKDAFYPARFVASGVEVRFSNFRTFQEMPYPKFIETQDLKIEALEGGVSVEAAEFKAPFIVGYTDLGNAAEIDVRNLIQQYYAVIR
jgi:hypothetical protein